MICDRCSIVCQFAGEPGDCKGVNVCDTKQTNADRIRNMTDEELAEWFYFSSLGFHYNQEEMLNWLKQEATDA